MYAWLQEPIIYSIRRVHVAHCSHRCHTYVCHMRVALYCYMRSPREYIYSITRVHVAHIGITHMCATGMWRYRLLEPYQFDMAPRQTIL